MHYVFFLICATKSKNLEQSQTNFAWSHDRETVTFRNSGRNVSMLITQGRQSKYLAKTQVNLTFLL